MALDAEGQCIPKGSFDFYSQSLSWKKTTVGKNECQIVEFPWDRVEDFVAGENKRNKCEFYLYGGGKNENAAEGLKVLTTNFSRSIEKAFRHSVDSAAPDTLSL